MTSSSGTVSSAQSSVTSLPAGTKVETFETWTVTGASYVSGTFTGQYGVQWAYNSCAAGETANIIAGSKTPVFGKGKTPAGSVSATIPNGIGQLSFKYKQAFSTTVNFRVKVNGTTIDTITSGGASVTTAGPYTVSVAGSATLVIEQTGTASGQLAIDDITWTDGAPPETDKPTVSIDSPTASQTVTGYTATISGTAADPGTGASGVKEVWIKVDGGSAVKASGTTSWTWVSGELPAGTYSASVWSIDNAGNVSQTNTRVFTLAWPYDVTPPTVEFTEFAGSAIGGTAADNLGLITNVKVSLDNVNGYNATGTTRWSYTFSGLSTGGSYTLYAKAYDKAGNVTNPVKTYSYTKTTAWTVMVYLDADNDLEPYGVSDFNEMEKGIYDAVAAGNTGITTDLQVIVMMDRVSGYSTGDGNWTDTRLFKIKPDDDPSVSASERLDDGGSGTGHIANLGEKNMGDPANLGMFIDYCKANFPAQNYGLVLWNHGGGSRSWTQTVTYYAKSGATMTVEKTGPALKEVCYDQTSSDDLYTDEIQQTIASRFSSSNKLGFIGFDACLMGAVEVAYEFRDLASYMAGSMNSEGGNGWDYTYLFSNIGAANITPAAFVSAIVDQYQNQYKNTGSGETQSAIDLSQITLLKTRIDELAVALAGWVAPGGTINTTAKGQLETIRDAAVHYYSDDADSAGIPFYDLYSLCSGLNASADTSSAVKTAALAVNSQLALAVVKAYGDSGISTQPYYFGTGASVGRGLTIFFSRGNVLDEGTSHYMYHWWYTAEDTQVWWESGRYYGKIDFCNSNGNGTRCIIEKGNRRSDALPHI